MAPQFVRDTTTNSTQCTIRPVMHIPAQPVEDVGLLHQRQLVLLDDCIAAVMNESSKIEAIAQKNLNDADQATPVAARI